MLVFILKGIIIGFSLAAPVGPIGVLCMRRTLARGGWRGFTVGLSGASADIVYALVAAFGVSLISDYIAAHEHWIRLVGGILLLILGLYLYRSHPEAHTSAKWVREEAQAFVSIFFLALTNPLTLFAYSAAFSGIGVESIMGDGISVILLVAGVFLGSLLWFTLLTSLTRLFRDRVTTHGLSIINKAAGTLLMLFGLLGVWSGLRWLW
jgi:threonine/homoserine/homoserine lactone efflux protein